ncbi:hypothetical protein SPRG_11523 [Saprolegnia parasitica CBS 223.65]|uniref:Apple domain-containing protein n=1 Tax=Saprolegnia parasitica (strain CBS 223.65) TaxID=695850 RepID=A0A067C2R2_SAPPC|nr:hypothetical protein SPRG_11523 [Saprolegnia parasitica CBS 223.65]KDO23430.1 hypothetical protein SPRG_11523 [Saprolegnia parasitica CBS 223.65]|eukprot:XP_012205917.1 hypothetical protein SPRG_11523 [Saprolegnia parasitica CBS 223.65]
MLHRLALLSALASAAKFSFTNKCSYPINLHGGGSVHICDIAPGATTDCGVRLEAGQHGLFKHTATDEANLVEYSLVNAPGFHFVWYDVSNIPPGPGFCKSYEDCKAKTGGKSGYNVPLTVTPTKHQNRGTCKELVDLSPTAPDTYLFPEDNTKTHACPMDEAFLVTFCPHGGDGAVAGCGGVETNRDYFGNDIGHSLVSGDEAAQAAACCASCSATQGCVGYTVNQGTCWLKSSMSNSSYSATAFSSRRKSHLRR